MVGVGAIVTGVAPLAGGLLLGGMAGKSGPSVPDLRAIILSELDLLQRIPEEEVDRRAAFKRVIAEHIEALLVAQEKSREFKRKTRYFTEHWRDIIVLCHDPVVRRDSLACRPLSSGLASAANCHDCDVGGYGYLCGARVLD